MRLHEFVIKRITEGGNIFKDPTGQSLTQRIQRSEIEPTIRWMEEITGLPLLDNTLGSVGKKEHSGDLDIAVDQNAVTKDELASRLTTWVEKQGHNPKDWVRKSGVSVHFKTPIQGNPKLGFVQTDFMFGDDIEQMKFGLFSAGEASKYSGADRNLLMSSLAKSLLSDLKYSWQKGLIKRSTSELITKNPDEVAYQLLGKGHDRSDLDSVETIMAAVSKDPRRLKGLKQLITDLRDIEGKKASEVKSDAEEANRIERILAA